MPSSCHRPRRVPSPRAVLLSLLTLTTAPFAEAQSAPAPSATASSSATASVRETDTIVLSPFTVSGDQDNGYQAANTLAGSRLNTKLSETPASVSVFTDEFLKDLGATGLAQVLEFFGGQPFASSRSIRQTAFSPRGNTQTRVYMRR